MLSTAVHIDDNEVTNGP